MEKSTLKNKIKKAKDKNSFLSEKPILTRLVKEGKNSTSIDEFKDKLDSLASLSEPVATTIAVTKRLDSASGGETKGETNLLFPASVSGSSAPSTDKTNIPKTPQEFKEGLEGIIESYRGVTDEDMIPEEYKPKVNESLGLSKVPVPEINKDKIKEEVTQEETKKTENKKQSEEDKVNEMVANILAEMENKKESSSATKAEINKIYDDYKLSSENEALKRGLSRSSTILLTLDGIEKQRAEELSNLATTLEKDITTLETKITGLKNELVEALNTLDLELSQNINAELKNRIEELEEKQKEAIEFNNNVAKLESEYARKKKDYVMDAIELEEELKNRYYGSAEESKREDLINYAMKYFSAQTKQDALKELTSSSELAKILGSYYYDLYYLLMRRDN